MLLGADSERDIRVTHPLYFRRLRGRAFSMEEYERGVPWLTPEPTPN